MKTRFPVEKHEDESGTWQQGVKLPITARVLGHGCFVWLFIYLVLIPVSCFVVLFSFLFRLQLSLPRPTALKLFEYSSLVFLCLSAPILCKGTFWFSRPAKPAVFGIGESIKHKFRVFQVYRFQNWYQSNTPLNVNILFGNITHLIN